MFGFSIIWTERRLEVNLVAQDGYVSDVCEGNGEIL
jgi:hypothetical protein